MLSTSDASPTLSRPAKAAGKAQRWNRTPPQRTNDTPSRRAAVGTPSRRSARRAASPARLGLGDDWDSKAAGEWTSSISSPLLSPTGRAARARTSRQVSRARLLLLAVGAIWGSYPVLLRAINTGDEAPMPAVFLTAARYILLAGFSRAVRRGDHIFVSGTTATHGDDNVCAGDPHGQATYILDKITSAIAALGGSREDVVRTRIYLTEERNWEPVCRTHGRFFGEVRPANTLVVVAALVGEGYDVEIEAEAIVPPQRDAPAAPL